MVRRKLMLQVDMARVVSNLNGNRIVQEEKRDEIAHVTTERNRLEEERKEVGSKD